MSIPPLVCSTPPPLEQCEDDKDHEDFDLHYNSSQDDDDDSNDYDYGNFSTYNHFQSTISENKKLDVPVIAKSHNKEKNEEIKDSIDIVLETPTTGENKNDEDINIEDLNLKMDEEPIGKEDHKESELDNHDVNCSGDEQDIHIPDITNIVNQDDEIYKTLDSSCVEPATSSFIQKTQTHNINEIVKVDPDHLTVTASDTILVIDNNSFKQKSDLDIIKVEESSNELKNIVDDDFGDFEDFHSVNPNNDTKIIVDNCDNPWQNEIIENENSDFGAFKTNFNENSTNLQYTPSKEFEHSNQCNHSKNETKKNDDDDDDFGDFDDFKTSAFQTMASQGEHQIYPDQQITVLNLQSQDNDNVVEDSINKVLSAIFPQEFQEEESDFQGKLESLLGETWGHLMETDVRQPYIINWNNSLGQKTLLKALCIDSRNILFGPNWSYNMPKYAVNLSTAPLQPLKNTTSPSTSQNEHTNHDKTASKTGTWSDPFTSDGQESCNTERADVESRPLDLNAFEGTLPTKSNEIYSSTLSVQPLRHINLPDTHIFTPTDSETPRSKTIHYDSGTSVPLHQPVVEISKNEPEKIMAELTVNVDENNLENENEYSEFQDFRGTSNVKTLTLDTVSEQSSERTVQTSIDKNIISNKNITYQTQILQPIKVEPIMPTLNWPDPGEIKETFEDFSDYMSNSSWKGDKLETLSQTNQVEDTSSIVNCESVNNMNNKAADIEPISNIGDSVDDEFDTFQSALPPSKITHNEQNYNNLENDVTIKSFSQNVLKPATTQILTNKVDTDIVLSKINKDIMSETISITNTIKSSETFSNDVDSNLVKMNSLMQPLKIQMINNNILQPTPASSSGATQNQQKSGQILQPLSLESYSQINWPNPGIDLQDLSRFNPVESLQSLKSDTTISGQSTVSSPAHQKNSIHNQMGEDDIWGEYVSSKPKQQPPPKKSAVFVDDDEWTDFVSSPSVKPQNGLNTISLNVHTNSNMQKSTNQKKFTIENKTISLDIPTLNYITPKSNNHKSYNDRHFQNL